MSRYIGHTEQHAFAYGFDACGIPGYFVTADKDFDTRKFMADEGCHVSRGRILEMLTEMNNRGANVPEDHLTAIALDLPF
jgi:hypothetical protein